MSNNEVKISLQLRWEDVRVSLLVEGVSGYAPDVLADAMKQVLIGFREEVKALDEAGVFGAAAPPPD